MCINVVVDLKSLCIVSADLTKLRNSLLPQYSNMGGTYYSYKYDFVISFGGTELQAQISWKENVGYSAPVAFMSQEFDSNVLLI